MLYVLCPPPTTIILMIYIWTFFFGLFSLCSRSFVEI